MAMKMAGGCFRFFALLVVFATMILAQLNNGTVARSNNDYALIDSRIVTIKGKLKSNNYIRMGPEAGKLLPDSCEIELQLKPGERAIEARGKSATRVTADGCELEMEIGRPPETVIAPVTPPAARGDAHDRSTESVSPFLAASSPGPLAISPGTSSGYTRGWFTDPVAIWVNSEQVDLSWIWTSPFNCAYLYSWSRSVPAFFAG